MVLQLLVTSNNIVSVIINMYNVHYCHCLHLKILWLGGEIVLPSHLLVFRVAPPSYAFPL